MYAAVAERELQIHFVAQGLIVDVPTEIFNKDFFCTNPRSCGATGTMWRDDDIVKIPQW